MTQQPGPVPGAKRMLIGVVCLLAALAVWLMRNQAAAWAAASMVATAELVTTSESDDARINRAFAAARQNHPNAALAPAPNGLRQIRHNLLSVRGRSEGEALAELDQLSAAVSAEFKQEGPGELTVYPERRAKPFLDDHAQAVKRAFQYGALAAGLLGLLIFATGWLRLQSSPLRMPASFWWPIAAFLCMPFLGPAGIIMLIPAAIAARICYGVAKTGQAAKWPSTSARIVRSAVKSQKRQDSSVVNLPSIEYEFAIGGKSYRGSRISAVEKAADRDVKATLDRYPVGATAPVYYNPANPEEAVLEHDLPLPAAALYAIAGGIFMAGLAAVLAFANVAPLMEKLRMIFPPGAEPQAVFFFGLGAVMLLAIQVSYSRDAKQAVAWPAASGRIVSSRVESHMESVGGRQGNRVRFYQAVVEYAYTVGSREYHSTRLSFGPKEETAQAPAEAKAARYPEGSAVTVHYDPENPASAVLDVKVARQWLGWLIMAVFLALALHFSAVLR